ncbi:hypothetical protein ABK040_007263 [Willaertia magna]
MLNNLIKEQYFRDRKLIGFDLPIYLSDDDTINLKQKEDDKTSDENNNHDLVVYNLSQIFKEIYKELNLTPKQENNYLKVEKTNNYFSKDTLYVRKIDSSLNETKVKESIEKFGNFISLNEIWRNKYDGVNVTVKCYNEKEAKEMYSFLHEYKPLSGRNGLAVEYALEGLITMSDLIKFCSEPEEKIEVFMERDCAGFKKSRVYLVVPNTFKVYSFTIGHDFSLF